MDLILSVPMARRRWKFVHFSWICLCLMSSSVLPRSLAQTDGGDDTANKKYNAAFYMEPATGGAEATCRLQYGGIYWVYNVPIEEN